MDKITYLRLKQELTKNSIKYQREDYCYNCVRLLRNCLCSLISPFKTDIHFVLLTHPKEAKKEKIGTGKISHLSLINSQIITGVDFSNDPTVNALIKDENNYCAILYPGQNAINISNADISALTNLKMYSRKIVLFVIDGTWPCSKKIMKNSINLRMLPRFSFAAHHTSIFEIKEQPADFCLSTLESIHFFIKECNRRGLEKTANQEDQMIKVFKAMIDYQIKCSLNPNLKSHRKKRIGYSKKEDRTKSKKWLTRNIIFTD
jgi:DTW domain-containing protein YfiP